MTKIVDIEDIRKKREKKEIGIPIENINKKELKRRGHEIGDILGCDEKGEEICVRKGKGNLYVDGDMEKEHKKVVERKQGEIRKLQKLCEKTAITYEQMHEKYLEQLHLRYAAASGHSCSC